MLDVACLPPALPNGSLGRECDKAPGEFACADRHTTECRYLNLKVGGLSSTSEITNLSLVKAYSVSAQLLDLCRLWWTPEGLCHYRNDEEAAAQAVEMTHESEAVQDLHKMLLDRSDYVGQGRGASEVLRIMRSCVL